MITIETVNGERLHILSENDSSVGSLKASMLEQKGIPVEQQTTLIYDKRQLDNEISLRDANIGSGSILYLVVH